MISISSLLTGMGNNREIISIMVTVEKRSMVTKQLLQWLWSGASLLEEASQKFIIHDKDLVFELEILE